MSRSIARARRPLLACAFAVGSLLAPAAVLAQSTDSVGVVRGVVVAAEEGQGLPFAIVSLLPAGTSRFANEDGSFSFGGLAPGTYTLAARQLGFTPAEVRIVVEAGATPVPVRIALRRVAIELTGVRVVAPKPCRSPGAPDSATSPRLWVVFQQLRENAVRYQLLADRYPFRYQMERRLGYQFRGDDPPRIDEHDTVLVQSDSRWRYAPGRVVERSRRSRYWTAHVPTLPDFADRAFHRTHCFEYGGLETIDGRDYVRVDFQASVRLRSPDVNGSVHLDPATFQIRRAELFLTKQPPGVDDVASTSVVTWFREVAPSLVIIDRIVSTSTFRPNRTRVRSPLASVEMQQLVAFAFVKGDPRASTPPP